MVVTEKGEKFRKISEHTLIEGLFRGRNELAAIVRSILEAKRLLED